MLKSEEQPAGGAWPRLRRDLEISDIKEGQNGNVVLVRDPHTAELFEFSEQDHFLLACLDGNLGAASAIARFAERFKQRVTPEQLDMFVGMVREWGLLEPGPGDPARTVVGPLDADQDSDGELIIMPGGLGGLASGGLGGVSARPGAGDRASSAGQRRPRPRSIARPGLIAPDEVTAGEYTERPEDVREELEALGRRRGRAGGGGGGGGGGGRMGGGGRGDGLGGGGPTPDWEPEQQIEGADDQPFDQPPSWTWFRPQRLFAWLGTWLWPLRFVAYLTPLIVGVGVWTLLDNFEVFAVDFMSVRRPLTLFQHLLFGLVTMNLAVQVGRGIACTRMGGQALRFGIRLAVGLIPRFSTQLGGLDGLQRSSLLWIHGTPLLIRINIFGLAAVMWFLTRQQGNALYAVSIMLSMLGLFSFFMSANPLMRGNGYHLLTVWLEMPDLRQRANRALFSRLRGAALPDGEDNAEGAFALRMYALASIIFVLVLAGVILFLIGQWLELNYQGTGVALFLLLLVFLVWYFGGQARARKESRQAQRMRTKEARIAELRGGVATRGPGGGRRAGGGMGGGGMGDMAGGMGRIGPGGAGLRAAAASGGFRTAAAGGGPRALARLQSGMPGEVTAPMPARAEAKPKGNPFIRFGLLALLIAALFLPYHYEPGGPVSIMPLQQQELHSEIAGVIGTINYNGGETVKGGEVIAEVASLEEQKNVQTTRADIARRQADLEKLLSTPRPEDVALATQQLDTARTSAQFSSEEAARLETVYKAGHISLEDYQEARKRADVDAQEVLEAQANLRKVKAGPHPKEIEALRYEIAGLQDQLVYYESQLEKTRLIMPFDGRIVTINLRDRQGQFLDKGDFLAQIENDESVRVEFDIPQSDASEFGPGADVRIKIWTYPDRTFTGQVVDIAPVVAEEEGQGSVVKVTTVIPNPDGVLKSGMTGFGKIDGGTKPVIVAFSRAIVRFFLIEIWSWLP